MEKYYLGFDAGTQSVKAAVYDEDMKCVASCVNPTELYYPHPAGWKWMQISISGQQSPAFGDVRIR